MLPRRVSSGGIIQIIQSLPSKMASIGAVAISDALQTHPPSQHPYFTT